MTGNQVIEHYQLMKSRTTLEGMMVRGEALMRGEMPCALTGVFNAPMPTHVLAALANLEFQLKEGLMGLLAVWQPEEMQ